MLLAELLGLGPQPHRIEGIPLAEETDWQRAGNIRVAMGQVNPTHYRFLNRGG